MPVFVDPDTADSPELRRRRNERVSLKNLGWVRQYWTYNADNQGGGLATWDANGNATAINGSFDGLSNSVDATYDAWNRLEAATGKLT